MEARLGRCCHKSRNASGHQEPEKVKNGFPRACRGGAALPTPWFWLLASRTMRGQISLAWSHPLYGNQYSSYGKLIPMPGGRAFSINESSEHLKRRRKGSVPWASWPGFLIPVGLCGGVTQGHWLWGALHSDLRERGVGQAWVTLGKGLRFPEQGSARPGSHWLSHRVGPRLWAAGLRTDLGCLTPFNEKNIWKNTTKIYTNLFVGNFLCRNEYAFSCHIKKCCHQSVQRYAHRSHSFTQ